MEQTNSTNPTPTAAVPTEKSFAQILATSAKDLTPYQLVRVLESKCYPLPEAAVAAGVDPRQLRGMCREGKVPGATQVFKDTWMLDRAKFDLWSGARKGARAEVAAGRAEIERLTAQLEELQARTRAAKG